MRLLMRGWEGESGCEGALGNNKMDGVTLVIISATYTLFFALILVAYLLGWVDFEDNKILKSVSIK